MMKLIISIIVCQLAGVIGAVFTTPAIDSWYSGLNKPAFNPPNWLFGPVWTLLYLLMGLALYLIWQQKSSPAVKSALTVFAIQLGLNLLWSILFFGLQSPLAAFLEIILLWLFIVATIKQFLPLQKTAAYLLVPYLLWVSFANLLNWYIVRLN